MVDNFKMFHDLAQRVVEAFQIQLHEVIEPHHKVFYTPPPLTVALPVNEVLGPCQSYKANLCVRPANVQAGGQKVLCTCEGHRIFILPPASKFYNHGCN